MSVLHQSEGGAHSDGLCPPAPPPDPPPRLLPPLAPQVADAATKLNTTDITKFNITNFAAKFNLTVPPALKELKLPAAPEGLPPADELLSALKLPPLANLTRALTGQSSVNGTKLAGAPQVPPLEDVVKAVNAAGQVLSKLPTPERLTMPTVGDLVTAVNSVGARAAAKHARSKGRRMP
jgi:hypothetical protein